MSNTPPLVPCPKDLQIFPPPTAEEMAALFKTRSKWFPRTVTTDFSGPAIYFIRLVGEETIPRWMASDPQCLLYIGSCSSGKQGMKARSAQLADLSHGAVKRLSTLENQCPRIKNAGRRLDTKYCYVEAASDSAAIFWESYILLSYYFHFGDRPPQNRKLEYCYVKRHRNKHETVVSWSQVATYLR